MLLLCLAAAPAGAHAVSLGQSKIAQRGQTVTYELAVEYDELVKRVRVEPVASTERAEALRAARAALTAYLERNLQVLLDGEPCTARLDTIEVSDFRGSSYAMLSSSYDCGGAQDGVFEVRYGLFFDAISDAERSAHSNLADYDLAGAAGRTVFEPGHQRLVVGEQPALSSAASFVRVGLKHILGGADHVLFVLALLLGARSPRTILKVVTTFTAAHSVTLALAALGWVSLPPGLVEPAIALSIVWVAVQNILQKEPSHRLRLVFAFGLMHGLGFAAGVSFGEGAGWSMLTSLLAFNVGVEAGQAVVIALAAPVLLLAQRRGWSRPVRWTASGAIAAAGALWLIGRLPLP